MRLKDILRGKIGYYFITDAQSSRAGNLSDVESALSAGVKIVQYREKFFSTKEMYAEALKLRRICKNVTFLVNDRVDIALAVNADGIHLGQDDLPVSIARKLLGKSKIIGVTVHNLREAKEARDQDADYIGVSPIFATKTKLDARKPLGIDLIKKIKRYVRLPIIAAGGINLLNATEVICSGADGICAISAVVTKRNVKQQIQRFRELFKTLKNTQGG